MYQIGNDRRQPFQYPAQKAAQDLSQPSRFGRGARDLKAESLAHGRPNKVEQVTYLENGRYQDRHRTVKIQALPDTRKKFFDAIHGTANGHNQPLQTGGPDVPGSRTCFL